MRAGGIDQAELEADCSKDSGWNIGRRSGRLHDPARRDHGIRPMDCLAVHEPLQRENALMIRGVVRGRRQGRFREALRDAGMCA